MLTAITIVLITGVGVIWYAYPRWRFRSTMRKRPRVAFEDVYQREFADQGIDYDLAEKLWRRLSDCLDVPYGSLRPSDRYSVELAARKGWEYDDELGAVEHLLRDAARSRSIEFDMRSLKTVRDSITMLCKRNAT